MRIDSYRKQLAYHLRVRRVDEAEIAHILEDVDAHAAATGDDPEAVFGPPQTYAEQFPEGPRSWRRTAPVTTVLACLAIAWMVGVLVVVAATEFEPPFRFGAFLLWPALGLMVVGMIADITRLATMRLPSTST